MKAITRTIWILSLVSLFNDVASEMLIPVMPLYLKTIGFSVLLIGIVEGLAEAMASLSKGYFGNISDRAGRRASFVKWGYALSAVSKPMLVLFVNPVWVFFSRTVERFGKGIRTAARDAILSDESAHGDRGKVFGFHRSMDTLGAAIGPSLALVFLYYHQSQYKSLFYIAFFPGIVAVILTLFLKDKKKQPPASAKSRVSFFSQFNYWKQSTVEYRQIIIGLLFFTLFNSSDAFLILKMKEAGTSDMMVIVIYIFYNLIYAFSSFPMGIVADKIGLKKIFLTGLILFACVYIGMTFYAGGIAYIILFFLYGIYYACTEGIAKAWLSKTCDKKDTATALGFFSGLQGICTFMASTAAGFIWFEAGSLYTFIITAVAAFIAVVYLSVIKTPVTLKQKQ